MREIKFRGKSISNKNEWVYGSGISKIIINTYETNRYNIINNCDYDELDYFTETLYDTDEVIPETIGQFTGLKDKNGVEIYEGDIVKNKLVFMSLENIDVVEFNEVDCSFMLGKGKRHFNKNLELEVIGNIYENKELLEK